MKFLASIAAFFLICASAVAGERTVYAPTPNIGDSQPVQNAFGPQDPNLALSIPKWDGRDQYGNFVGYDRLREVRLQTWQHSDIQQLYIWNDSPLPIGQWQTSISFENYLSLADGTPLSSERRIAFGWASPGMTGGGVYSSGASGGFQGLLASIPVPEGDRPTLRKFAGIGSAALVWSPRLAVESQGFAGHWHWSADAFIGLWNWAGAGTQLKVTYVWSDTPTTHVTHVERTQWTDGQLELSSVGQHFIIDLPETADGARVAEVELFQWEHHGIENTSNIPGFCGGSASIRLGTGNLSVLSSQPVGSPAPTPAFDGNQDFAGVSAQQNWRYVSWPERMFVPLAPGQTQLDLTTLAITPNFVPLTSGTAFAWWAHPAMTVRARVISTY